MSDVYFVYMCILGENVIYIQESFYVLIGKCYVFQDGTLGNMKYQSENSFNMS